ncbi:MAG: acyl-CoA synthetase FdrA [Anaerolineae bacterium]
MSIQTLIKPSQYYDSVSLMLVARELTKLDGVQDAAVIMATEANKALLKEAGLLTREAQAAGPNDLVIAVLTSGENGAGQAALAKAESLLAQKADSGGSAEFRPKTLRGAARNNPAANLAVISVAGRYAVAEAWSALRSGLHVLLFSDNVPVEDEVALKTYARDHGLLLMGPDAGTAIINGAALGFANAVPRGPVGLVSASGTGLQEVSTLLAKLGVGVSQALGVGGRDVKASVGGLMMLEGLKALQSDPATQVLLLVSKPPDPAVMQKILGQVQASDKPAVVCFLGGDPELAAGAIPARTLQEAAYLAAAQVEGYEGPDAAAVLEMERLDLVTQATHLRTLLKPEQKYLRGLFSGGTLAAETLLLWNEQVGGVWSNIAPNKQWQLPRATESQEHTVVDLGEDEFTVGRPHPMIDNDLRMRRMLREAADPSVAVVMLDVVLGYGAHPDPASELGPAIRQMKTTAAGRGHELIVVGAVTGTEADPQRLSKQVAALEASGMLVLPSNAAAAKLAALIVK